MKVFSRKKSVGNERMKNDKSPGSDGLDKEFYVCFFNEASNILITALNHFFTTGMQSTSQCQALITLIEKKVKIRGL